MSTQTSQLPLEVLQHRNGMSTTRVNNHTNAPNALNILAISVSSLVPRKYLGRIIPCPQLREEGRPDSPSSLIAPYFYRSNRYFYGSLEAGWPPRCYPRQHIHQQSLEHRFGLFATGEAELEIRDSLDDPCGHTVEYNLDK